MGVWASTRTPKSSVARTRTRLIMERTPDTEIPAILLNGSLRKTVSDRICVCDTEDVVHTGAKVEPAEGSGREERKVGEDVAAGDGTGERTSCTHVLRVNRRDRARAEDRRP